MIAPTYMYTTLFQPNYILLSKYLDRMCHTVIKPQIIKQMKAHKYSNIFQMQEHKGTFIGIDTCNITQYHNFKLSSILLEGYKPRSLSNFSDANMLLTQL